MINRLPLKPIVLALTFALLSTSPTIADNIANSDKNLLDRLVVEALSTNQELQAAASRWEMYTQKVVPAQALNDPRLSVGLVNYPADSLATDEIAMTGTDLRLEQAFPFPGKLGLKGKVAEQKATWFEALYKDLRYEVVRQVNDAWYRLYAVEQSLRLIRSNIVSVEQLVQLAETRYAVGQGMQKDVLQAQLQRSRLLDRELELTRQREGVVAELTALLNRNEPVHVEMPASLDEPGAIPDLKDSVDAVAGNRPVFMAYQALVDQYEAESALAEKDYYPDFGLWASYRVRDDNLPDGGEDFISAGISMNLPIYLEKRRAKVADAKAGLTMAKRQYRQLVNRVSADLADSHAQLERSRNRVLLFKSGIVPQAELTYEAGLRAYQVGKIQFKELIDSLMSLYSYEAEYHQSLSSFYRALARFERLAGSTPALLDEQTGEQP